MQNVPRPTLQRLPAYLQMLKRLQQSGASTVSCNELAEELGLNAVSVRKDIAAVSTSGGRPKIGYDLDKLILDVERYLGYSETRKTVLVGVGHLGGALLAYPGFRTYGVEIIAAFDSAPELIGTVVAGHTVFDIADLTPWCQSHHIDIGILTVPAQYAQDACSRLVAGGIRGILNFAPTHLHVPAGILVQNEDMAIPLALLSKHVDDAKRSDIGR